jgi:predicted DCC family thiol-disulfide oxidoreductase YuxK
MSSDNALTVIFDTDCVLCSAFVHFILKHEREPTTRFVSAWSDIGAVLASEHGLTTDDLDRTYLVIDGQRGLTRSDAGLAIMRRLRFPWRLLAAPVVVPRPLRDVVYRLVARNRYRWFGHRPACFVPPVGQETRFVNGVRSATSVPDHRQAAARTQ